MPKGTRVHRCVEKLKKDGKEEGAAIAICQDSTKQGYATGRDLEEEQLDEILGLVYNVAKDVVKGTVGAAKGVAKAGVGAAKVAGKGVKAATKVAAKGAKVAGNVAGKGAKVVAKTAAAPVKLAAKGVKKVAGAVTGKKDLADDDFQQNEAILREYRRMGHLIEEVRGANSDAMKWLKARMDKAAEKRTREQAAQSITTKLKQMKPRPKKDKKVDEQLRAKMMGKAAKLAGKVTDGPSLKYKALMKASQAAQLGLGVKRAAGAALKSKAKGIGMGMLKTAGKVGLGAAAVGAGIYGVRKLLKSRKEKKAKEAAKSSRKDELTLPKQTKPSKGMKSTSYTRKLKSGEYGRAGKGGGPRISRVGIKQKETDDKREHGSIRDHKLLAYKDLAYRLDELLGALMGGVAGGIGSLLAKKTFGKSAEKKAKEKALARKKAKAETGVDPGKMEEVTGGALLHKGIKKLDRTKTGRKALGATKGVARVAGLVPGVGAVGDAAAMGIAASQRAGAKTAKRKKELNKEIAGDAAALVPGAGLATRGAQYAAKAGKAVRGTKAARKGSKLGKLRGRAGAAVRKHGTTAAKAGEHALIQKLKDKSMEDHTEMSYKNAYVTKLVETRKSKETQASEERGRARDAEAARTHPSKRTPAEQKRYEAARRRYQETGQTPFKTRNAMRKEQKLKDAGLGDAPHRSNR